MSFNAILLLYICLLRTVGTVRTGGSGFTPGEAMRLKQAIADENVIVRDKHELFARLSAGGGKCLLIYPIPLSLFICYMSYVF
jgi:hypothetical protein